MIELLNESWVEDPRARRRKKDADLVPIFGSETNLIKTFLPIRYLIVIVNRVITIAHIKGV